MRKKVIRYSGGPFIKNASMIGAGNKFQPAYDANGKIQWAISVQQQSDGKQGNSVFKQKVDSIIASRGNLAKPASAPTKNIKSY